MLTKVLGGLSYGEEKEISISTGRNGPMKVT